jgi:cytochrome c peroxidase
MSKARVLVGAGILVAASSFVRAQAPPPGPLPAVPPVPTGNPITEAKRALGKILFWDEQLSADSTVACGTCHSNGRSGTDGRIGINPGFDGNFTTTADNVNGSPGVVHADVNGNPVLDALFGMSVQVTRRSAPASVVAAFSPELFWDGRGKETFIDPESNQVSLSTRGALESQAVGPLLSSVEMGRDGRTWASVAAKLATSEPLGNATVIPADLAPIVGAHPTYGDLFQAAFGDRTITAERIAFAIATYERTLVPNQTPWDRFVSGNPAAMTQGQIDGWNFFRNSPCSVCHRPPTFSDNVYHNIGVRPPDEDRGHGEVTGAFNDRGKFKTPTLRGVGLKVSYMHTGVFNNLTDVILHYRPGNPNIFLENIDPILPVGVPPQVQPALVDFMANALTDPRVRDQQFPFDQPTLHANALPQLSFDGDKTTMRWPALSGVLSYVMYRGDLADLVDGNLDGLPDAGYGVCMNGVDPNVADAVFVDTDVPVLNHGFFYVKGVKDGAIVRGLGVTSAVKAREPGVACP